MRMYDIIEHKRDGRALSPEEISYFVQGYVAGEIPDYQASALLMAIFLCGMDARETAALPQIEHRPRARGVSREDGEHRRAPARARYAETFCKCGRELARDARKCGHAR